jgi:hypothetical protein
MGFDLDLPMPKVAFRPRADSIPEFELIQAISPYYLYVIISNKYI